LRSIQPLPLASAELGFSLDQDLVGQGLAGEALLLLADYLRHGTDLHKITARSLAAHTRCNRLLARLGFVKSGIDQQAVLVDGEWQDLLCWQLFPASPGPAQSVPAPGGPFRQKNAPSV
jgi:ribosomal-protein-alanine N-acetyltransferase